MQRCRRRQICLQKIRRQAQKDHRLHENKKEIAAKIQFNISFASLAGWFLVDRKLFWCYIQFSELSQFSPKKGGCMLIKLRAHHISNVSFYLFHNSPFFFDWLYSRKYGPFRFYAMDIMRTVLQEPSVRIRIVRGLDDICCNTYAACPIREKVCEEEDVVRDKLCENSYGLVVGRKYSSTEIIDMLRTFKINTGFDCPEDRLAHFFGLDDSQLLLA